MTVETDQGLLDSAHMHQAWRAQACNDSNLHVVQAGNLGAVDGGRLPRLLVVAAPRANRVTGRAAGVAERRATGGVAQAPWTPP